MNRSIDVVIPSFRLNEVNLLPVFRLRTRHLTPVRFYLVIDNPQAEIPDSIRELAGSGQIKLLLNSENKGASFTRNRGLEAGTGEWILFLDDDLQVPENLLEIYLDAALHFPEETGFIGLVSLPAARTDFTRAIETSGAMDIFSVAARRPSFAWGATANIMLSRSAIGEERFSLLFPKSGGGEDVDLLLRIREKNGYRNYKTLPQASVEHPWWKDGRVDFKKPWRYGKGNSLLGERNPAYAYHDFFNTPETLLLSLPLLLILLFLKFIGIGQALSYLTAVILIECVAIISQTLKRNYRTNPRVIAFVFLIRLVYESGLLWANISRFRWRGIGERFHDDGRKNKFFFYRTNTHKIVKWILYPLLVYRLFR